MPGMNTPQELQAQWEALFEKVKAQAIAAVPEKFVKIRSAVSYAFYLGYQGENKPTLGEPILTAKHTDTINTHGVLVSSDKVAQVFHFAMENYGQATAVPRDTESKHGGYMYIIHVPGKRDELVKFVAFLESMDE